MRMVLGDGTIDPDVVHKLIDVQETRISHNYNLGSTWLNYGR